MNEETLDYRLTSIENTLSELKEVVVENRLQAKDIEEIKLSVNNIQSRVADLEAQPNKEKALKWSTISDMVFKAIITVIIAIVLAKIGLTK